MEFKGTKGKWILGNKEINNGKYSICAVNYHLPNQETVLANALLISKAPEMLEMLKSFVDSCCGEQECEEELIKGLGHELYNNVLKAKQLIKQATEIQP